ncbi:MAG: sodium-dependent bicarbonate transport family permease [Cyanobacteria bacterium J06638_7]
MEFLTDFFTTFVSKLQSPTLGFLIGGLVVASLGSRLAIPEAAYNFIVFMLLMKVGLSGGTAIRSANLSEMLLPAAFAVALGIFIVVLGRQTLARLPNVIPVDAIATAGLFGAVSGSTLAASLTLLEGQGISYEPWAAALYPFMDIPALVTAIVLGSVYVNKDRSSKGEGVQIWPIVKESLQGSALSALLLGVALGLFTNPERVYESFFDPLFRGLLSVLMLVMGLEAAARLRELRKVAQWYAVYAVVAPLVHGFLGFGLGMIAHYTTGFSLGGVVILATIAASSSDISGPPTLRAGLPNANPSAYIGSSTAIGTPIAIAIGIPLFIALAQTLGAT